MIQKIFTIWDAKAEAYGHPFNRIAKGVAVRDFADRCNNPQEPIALHPEDYQLFEIGEYDDQTATITMLDTRVPLGSALEYINKDKPTRS